MAVIKQGILGGFSGSVANVVGSSWKGKAVMKSKPLSVANPRTAAQTAQRSKMANIVAFASFILASIIKPLWDRFQTGQSGYNAFVKENLHLFEGPLPSPAADLVISKGKMEATPITQLSGFEGEKVSSIKWPDDSGIGYKLADDKVFFVAFNERTAEVAFSSAEFVRSDAAASVYFSSDSEIGDVIRGYLAFARADGTVVSNTSTLQHTVTA